MAPIVRDYTVILTPEPEAGGYSVTVPALPEVATQGETVEEALAMAREAIELSLEVRRDEGDPIPADVTPLEQRVHVEIDAA
ncbi:MAG TPA: type II toxin-antitoxin system HicB family antitoxin [Candidatus Acidoferrales bacterium]|nr:type II toxin-antitoxin system HicB family antitoxin [Candidatus Acidoferrales bacterium]